jgi:hypothetical protein
MSPTHPAGRLLIGVGGEGSNAAAARRVATKEQIRLEFIF